MKVTKIEKGRARIQLLIRIVVSVGLMYWLITIINWKEAFQMIKECSPLYLILAFFAIQLTVATSIWKWKMLITSSEKKCSGYQASPVYLAKLYYIGLFFNNFMPGSVGGDVVRIYYLGKKTNVATATISVLFERITAGFALVGIVFISALFMDETRPYLILLLVITGISVGLYFVMKHLVIRANSSESTILAKGKLGIFIEKGKRAMVGLADRAKNYRNESWQWWGMVLFLSFLFQVGMAWINDLLFQSFGIHVPLLANK